MHICTLQKIKEIVIDYPLNHRQPAMVKKVSRVKIENKTNGENHPSHIELGWKKLMSEYTLKDIPQLHEEIAELFSDLLGPLDRKSVV